MKNTQNIPTNAYHETKRHSDTMFPYNVYPCTIPQDFPFVPMHWQDSMELIYIKKGTGLVQIDLSVFEAQAGDIFLALPGHIHGLRGRGRQRMEYENVIFDLDFLSGNGIDLCSQKFWQPLANGSLTLPVFLGKGHPLQEPVRRCLDASDDLCSRQPPGYELGVKGNLFLIFSLLFQTASPQEGYEEKRTEKLKTVLSILETDYDKKLSIETMAGRCGYSASHFMRWFKETTGTTFSSYLIEFRLGKAAQDLKNTSDTVLVISERNGFDNLSNFNRLFKKKFEMTPSQFRRSSRQAS